MTLDTTGGTADIGFTAKLHEICSTDSRENNYNDANRCQILRLKCTKFDFSWGSARDPAGVAYSTPQDPLAGGEGLAAPLQEPHSPLSALRASDLYMKFGQLILAKIVIIVATRCQILRLKCTKFDISWGSAPDPAGELTALPRPH